MCGKYLINQLYWSNNHFRKLIFLLTFHYLKLVHFIILYKQSLGILLIFSLDFITSKYHKGTLHLS